MIHSHLSRLVTSVLAAGALLLAGTAGAATASAATVTGTVSGVLTGTNGVDPAEPLEGAAVELEDVTAFRTLDTAWVDEDGSFTLDVAADDDVASTDELSVLYNYCIDPSCSSYPQEWWGGAYSEKAAQTFTLTDGDDFDASYQLTLGGTVSGRIVGPGDSGVPGSSDQVIAMWVADGKAGMSPINPGTPLDSDGRFTISGVPSGADLRIDYDSMGDPDDVHCYQGVHQDLSALDPGEHRAVGTLHDSYSPSIVMHAVDEGGDPVGFLSAAPLIDHGDGDFEGLQAGPYGTRENGFFQFCGTTDTRVKLGFVDDLDSSWGQQSGRTEPLQTVWVGEDGARGSDAEHAPIIDLSTDEMAGTDQVKDLGTVIIHPRHTPVDPAPSITAGTLTLRGHAQVGKKLRAATAGWSPAGVSFKYRWFHKKHGSWQKIKGKKGHKKRYKVRPGDRHHRLRVKVTATLAGADSVTLKQSSAKAAPGKLSASVPKVKGKTKVGKKLRAKHRSWTAGTSFKYRWFHKKHGSWQKIKGKKGHKKRYKVRPGDRHHRLRVKVTGKKTGYAKRSRTSVRTAKVR